MGVGRLLSLADLDDQQGRGCMNNARGVEPMTAQEWLDELERLGDAATPGPWAYEQHGDTNECGVGVLLDNDNEQVAGENSDPTLFVAESIAPEVNSVMNAAYIVAACNAVPRLVKMLKLEVRLLECPYEDEKCPYDEDDTVSCAHCKVQRLYELTEPKE